MRKGENSVSESETQPLSLSRQALVAGPQADAFAGSCTGEQVRIDHPDTCPTQVCVLDKCEKLTVSDNICLTQKTEFGYQVIAH